MNDKVRARIGVLFANFFFGTSVVAVKHITPALLTPMALTAVRIGCATLLFWSVYLIRPARTGIRKKDFSLLLLCAATGIVMNQTFTMRGMALTSPVHASLLILTTPITITILAAWILKEKFTVLKTCGLLLGIAGGVTLIFSRDLSAQAGSSQATGDLFVIAGAVSYSIYVIAVKPLMARYNANHILQWVFLFAAFFSIPAGIGDLGNAPFSTFDGVSWFSLGYIVLGSTFLAYRFMNYGIDKLGAGVTGSYMYTQPFFAAIASAILLHEPISTPKMAAGLLIMTGVFLTNYKKSRTGTTVSPIVSEHA